MINQNIPNVLLGIISGASTVAVFAIALQIRTVFYSLSTTLSNVFVPLVNRVVAESDDNDKLTGLMTRVGRYQALIYCWVIGGFVVLGRWFIQVWVGESFADVYWLILAMVIPLMIPLVQNTGVEIQKAKNKHKVRSVAYLVAAVLNLSITVSLAPSLGYWAPVVGFDVYVILGTGFFMNWYYHSCIGLNMVFFWRRILPVTIVAATVTCLCLAGIAFMPVAGLIEFLAWGFVYTLVYATAVWVFVLNAEEREAVFNKLGRNS